MRKCNLGTVLRVSNLNVTTKSRKEVIDTPDKMTIIYQNLNKQNEIIQKNLKCTLCLHHIYKLLTVITHQQWHDEIHT